MKRPKNTKHTPQAEGSLKHCWGRKRRLYKKLEKGIWKASHRLGILRTAHVGTEDSFWEDRSLRRRGWGIEPGQKRRKYVPEIRHGWCDYWGEGDDAPVRLIAEAHIDAPSWKGYDPEANNQKWPEPIAKSDRHLLQLLRAELRGGKS